jgi:hypothetical protein
MGQSQRYKELQLVQLRSFCLAATEAVPYSGNAWRSRADD